MAQLPEREQASASFDMLYTLAKMEVHQPTHSHGGDKGLLMPIGTSTGDSPLPWDVLEH